MCIVPRRVLHDEFFQKAKEKGYASRASFKLLQIQEKFGLIRRGDCVVDLGCAPGSWLQVAGELVGGEGRVVGVDLQGVRISLASWVVAERGDVFEVGPEHFSYMGAGRVDVMLSDMGPATDGHTEHYVSVRLCERVLELSMRILKPGGHLAMKVLEGSEYRRLLDETGGLFARCRGYKPKASRAVSREMYIIGEGFVGV